MSNAGAPRPLEGLRVIDLTRALAGPYATLLLAGLGAEVIKVEDPGGGDLARENSPYVGRDGLSVGRRHADDLSVSHLTRARGKRGITLNLKHPEARNVFADLVRKSDIVVENFTSGTAERLGVGYDFARAANPSIIYCSLSGFGATIKGQEGSRAMDVLIQALSGAMYASGADDEPPLRIGLPIADVLTPIFGVVGILAAVHQRAKTGEGQHVDVSMLGALTSLVAVENWAAMQAVGMLTRTGATLQRLCPFGLFQCTDGYIALVAVQDTLSHALYRAMQQPALSTDPRFATRNARVANATLLEQIIGEWTSNRTTADVIAALESENVPVALVRHPEEALADPRVVERGETMVARHPGYPESAELQTTGVPIMFSAARTGFDPVLPATIGEHNAEIFPSLLGYSNAEIERLASAGVI
ncbi:CaiB/BaiF CoA-transferase family protein [Povalibacter sp.]|uniref:CaiB/BaiF CoA transferase family protein n=1 Tax=Povalibacter sp. TaxID=1962978 RepID=UPI002F42F261